MKPPGAAIASASQSSCTPLSFSPFIWRASAWSTITLRRSSAQLFASTCQRNDPSTANAVDGSLWARCTRAWLMGRSVRLSQMSGCCQMALVQQDEHLCGSNIGHPKHEAMSAHERFSLIQNRSSAGYISLNKLQTGEKHFIGSEGIDAFHLSRQLKAVLPVLLSGIQVVPLVVDTGQAKIRFTGHRLRRITC